MSLVNTETGEIVERLTPMERSRLVHEEAAIEQGADQVAKALRAIRDGRLYREDFPTFEAYCQERWGMTRQHVNRQIVAAEVAAVLEPIGSKVPESHARELADLRDQPEQLREVYTETHERTEGNVTARAIREVREERTPMRLGRQAQRDDAEVLLNRVQSLADQAAREAAKLTAAQIARVTPKADHWTVGLRESVEVLEHLLTSLTQEK